MFNKEKLNFIRNQIALIGSSNRQEAEAASRQFAEAVELPLRKTLLAGDIVSNIFERLDYTDNPRIEFPLDLLTPGDEADHYAFVIAGEGRIPDKRVEADYLMVPTYLIGNAIDCNLRFIRDANWPVIQRMLEVLEAGFVKKINDDGWQTILAAATDRNILVNDSEAASGQFTPRLITLMSTLMRRNGGGNSSTLDRSKLTDLYVSPEAHMDIRAWGLDLIPDPVRSNIYYSSGEDQDLINIFGVRLHALDELGEGQAFQNYFSDVLNAGTTLTNLNDIEIVVGLDQQRSDSFIHPVRQELNIYEDNTRFRENLFSLFGNQEHGFAVLDNRRTLLGSI